MRRRGLRGWSRQAASNKAQPVGIVGDDPQRLDEIPVIGQGLAHAPGGLI
jgi:hypothetical protein